MHQVELRILGYTELTAAGRLTGGSVLRQPKRLALLAYLALAASDGYRRRDQIVALFWPDQDQLHARTQLRKALSALRAVVGPAALPSRGDTEVKLDTAAVWCDAVAFRRHVERAEWREAMQLYRGDLLEALFPGGVGQEFDAWLAEERASLRESAGRAAWEVSAQADMAGDRETALSFARRAYDLSGDDEESMRRLIAVLDRYGDRSGALKAFNAWQAKLHSEFGVDPAPETRRLARHVGANRTGESREALTPKAPLSYVVDPAPPPPAAPAVKPRDPARGWRRLSYAASVMAAVALLAALANSNVLRTTLPEADIAVFPLRAGGLFADGFAEAIANEIAAELARSGEVTVRSSTRLSTADTTTPESRGHTLRVAHALVVTVQQQHSRSHVVLRLIRVSDGLTIWGSAVDLSATDPLGSQVDLARSSAATVSARLRASQGRPRQ